MKSNAAAISTSRSRHLPLQGGCNFRDIGGYAASGGAEVKWGKVFRTGVLSYLTEDDSRALAPLQIKSICDLRRADERDKEPTVWADSSARQLVWGDGEKTPTVRSLAAQRPPTPAGMRDAMIELYRVLPGWMAPRIRGLFECVANDEIPLVIHCAAGKDRTGVAIAVLLEAIGVSRETIVADYLLTNDTGNFEAFILSRPGSQMGLADATHPLMAMPADLRSVIFAADARYLDAAFTTLDENFGGVERYLSETVKVDAPTLDRVRSRLLHRPSS